MGRRLRRAPDRAVSERAGSAESLWGRRSAPAVRAERAPHIVSDEGGGCDGDRR
jgi:hypothetical protein